jgi:hypothetical protein
VQSDTLARRVLMQTSPDHAQRRIDELWERFGLDIVARPEVYEAAIENANPADRELLRDVLPHTIEYAQAKTPAERDAIDAKYSDVVARAEARMLQDDLWFKVWLHTYFTPGSEQENEFLMCGETLTRAGRWGKPNER